MPLNIDDDAVRNIPEQPGVYLFKLGDKALYIGKASNLKKRVSQYFRGRDHITIGNLLKQSDGIEYIVTKNEKDALLLEYNLIHNYRPPFNIRLKDDKSFPFIEITKKDAFPGVYYSRHATPGNFRVGPITNSAKTRSLIDTITRVFKLRTCTTTAFNRGIPCLYYHIDRCSAPCAGKIKAEHYMADVKDAVDFLKGKRGKILENLKGKMTAAAEALEFEKAQEIKEDLQLLENFNPDSYISSVRKADYDVIALHYTNGYCFVVRFSVVEGRVKSKDFFDFDTFSGEREDVLRDFLISVYSGESIPPEIMVDVMPTDEESLMQLFSQLAGRKVRLKIPVKGDKRKLALLAAENLNYFIARTDYSAIGGR
ncbi:MAG: excinuclease ABC subunit C, partial [bacterium]|nr:excinuclease ABC subunit C [bacterium]